jgi:multidrug resistance protein, MATE family
MQSNSDREHFIRVGLLGNMSAVARLACPLALTNVSMSALMLTDTVMAARLGSIELAAVTLANAFYIPVTSFGIYLISPVAPMLSQLRGRKDLSSIPPIMLMATWLALSIAVLSAAILSFGSEILAAAGFDPALTSETALYFSTICVGIFPLFFLAVLRNFAAAFERPRAAFLIYLLAIPLNGFLDYALTFGAFGAPAMGVSGLGLATSFVNALMCVAMLVYCLSSDLLGRLLRNLEFSRPDWPAFRLIVGLGLPAATGILADVGMFAAATVMIGTFASDELAAHAIARQCLALSYQVLLGVGQALTIRVGVAVGNGEIGGIGRTLNAALGLSVLWLSLTSVLFLFAGRSVAQLFVRVPNTDPTLISMTASFLAAAAAFQIVDAAQLNLISVLRGFNDVRLPMYIQVAGCWLVGMPASLVLARCSELSGIGVWLGLIGGLGCVTLALTVRYRAMLQQMRIHGFRSANDRRALKFGSY